MSLRKGARALLVLAVIGISSCTSSVDREECAVYAAYVDKRFTMVADSSEPLKRHVICDRTSGLEMLRSWPKALADISVALRQDTIDDFVARNDRRYAINNHIGFQLPHRLIPDRSIEQLFTPKSRADGWLEFNRKYPKSHGILWLSRVGFSRDRNQALLYVGNQWTEAAGEGYLILLQKKAGVWNEVARSACWMS